MAPGKNREKSDREWIGPFQPRKPRKIRVRGVQDEPPVDGRGREVRIGGEVAGDSQMAEQARPGGEMTGGRVDDLDVRKAEPLLNPVQCLRDRKGIIKNPGVGADTDKSLNDHPCQGYALASGQAFLPPLPGFPVLGRADCERK